MVDPPNCVSEPPNSRLSGPQLPSVISSAASINNGTDKSIAFLLIQLVCEY